MTGYANYLREMKKYNRTIMAVNYNSSIKSSPATEGQKLRSL